MVPEELEEIEDECVDEAFEEEAPEEIVEMEHQAMAVYQKAREQI